MLVEVFLVHLAAMASPGPNVLQVTRTAIAESRRAGLYAALGAAASGIWSAFAGSLDRSGRGCADGAVGLHFAISALW